MIYRAVSYHRLVDGKTARFALYILQMMGVGGAIKMFFLCNTYNVRVLRLRS